MGEDLGKAQADLRQVGGDHRQFLVMVLERHVDQPSGIDHVVRSVEDATPLQLVGDLQVGQLVVGRTGHCRTAQLRHAAAIEHRTQATGREDVARGAEQGVVGHRMRAQLFHGQLDLAGVDVADQQFGASGMQLLGQGITDIAQALDRHPQALEVIAAQACHGSAANTGEHPHGRMGRRVASGAGTGDVTSLLGDAVHVGHRGAAVDGGDVASVQLLDATAEGFEQRCAILHMGRANDHGGAAALGQAGQRRLVAHALGQARGIGHGTGIVGIGQITTTAQGRPQAVVVDGDHCFQPGRGVDTQMQRFKAGAVHESEHRRAPESLLVVASIGLRLKIAAPRRNKPPGFATLEK